MEFIFGIFDNDENRKLTNLKSEQDAIEKILTPLQEKNELGFDTEYNMGIEEMVKKLTEYANSMTVFHFSGHHDKGELKLSDKSFVDEGLIDILNNAEKLKLVFINGCSSKKLVSSLDNVPIVIGTETPVYDDFAKELSIKFYELMTQKIENFRDAETIESIFEQSKGFYKGQGGGKERGIKIKKEPDATINKYIFQVNKNAKDFEDRVIYNIDPGSFPVHENYLNYTKEISKSEDLEFDFHAYFPFFISLRLESLVDSEKVEFHQFGLKRYRLIKRIIVDFFNFLRYSGFSLLWQLSKTEKISKKEFPDQVRSRIKDSLNEDWVNDFDLIKIELLVDIFNLIRDHSKEKDSLGKIISDSVLKNQELLLECRNLFNNPGEEREKDYVLFYKAEMKLKTFLESFRFLNGIGVESVYDIYYNQYKYTTEQSYRITRSFYPTEMRPDRTYKKHDEIKESDRKTEVETMDIQSVYLTYDFHRVLNISPFYIDANAANDAVDKIRLCFLKKHYSKSNTLKYEYFDKDKDEGDITVKKDENLTDQFKELEEKKLIYRHFEEFLKVIT